MTAQSLRRFTGSFDECRQNTRNITKKGRQGEIHKEQQQQPFNGRLSGATRVGRYQKKHSPAHTHPGQRTSFIHKETLQISTTLSH